MRSRFLDAIPLAALALGCSSSQMVSLSSNSAETGAKVSVSATSGGRSASLGDARFSPTACEGTDTRPETRRLTIRDVQDVLKGHGLNYKITQERDDLHIFSVEAKNQTVELRVATLGTAREAGRHLHLALLEHGQGYWGVHRSNIAILGAPGTTEEALGFAMESGLGCWGVFTAAGRDDTFVVPGGYFEF